MNRAQVVAAARGWIGTPYQHQQRLKGVAVDCAGLVIGVARELGIVPPEMDVTGYLRLPDGASLIAYCDQFMTRVPLIEAMPGDVPVVCHPRSPRRHAAHMGIFGDYPGGLSLIHANGTKVVEHRFDEDTRSRTLQVYRMPGVE
ncbi:MULTISPECIES: hypothetical protein [unclassified Methylibium]|uniref:hypothetical protein n=1 Tax=unclassified Methylibium TaxID=2633235 RepID=UPI0003F40E1F|nr:MULTISPECIES: hypothetical protein [unclassified Methylibium]EWS52660.1 putative phage cell wall peptidase, NlpC/P60 family [Methylibium sp. T29]EWS58659.1 putative phage cell wall peptidase, NlpC/P60 family [Methylibium sp. T29-B]